jgi:transcriptional regulator with XRE-family HTH domain
MKTRDILRKAFGLAVKRNRVNCGLTQEQLAEKIQLHRTYISDIERGARNLSFDSLARIAEGLSTPISVLIAEAESDDSQQNENPAVGGGVSTDSELPINLPTT